MGRSNSDETYLRAFNAAVSQREQISQEYERLKSRRILVEAAARALEPIVYPDQYFEKEPEQGVSSVIEIPSATPNVEIWNPTIPMEMDANVSSTEDSKRKASVQAVTQVYVHGDAEPEEEIQRRINIAIGRSAAD